MTKGKPFNVGEVLISGALAGGRYLIPETHPAGEELKRGRPDRGVEILTIHPCARWSRATSAVATRDGAADALYACVDASVCTRGPSDWSTSKLHSSDSEAAGPPAACWAWPRSNAWEVRQRSKSASLRQRV